MMTGQRCKCWLNKEVTKKTGTVREWLANVVNAGCRRLATGLESNNNERPTTMMLAEEEADYQDLDSRGMTGQRCKCWLNKLNGML